MAIKTNLLPSVSRAEQQEMGNAFRNAPPSLSGWPRLLMEGERHNLIEHSNKFEAFLPQDEWPNAHSGLGNSIVKDEKCLVYECSAQKEYHYSITVPNCLSSRAYTFSLYGVAFNPAHPINGKLTISDGKHTTEAPIILEKNWRRHSCSYLFPSSPANITITLTLLSLASPILDLRYKVSFTCLCLEEGLFPSSAILTSGKAGHRFGCFLSLDESKRVDFVGYGSLFLAYCPLWTSDKLTDDTNPTVFDVYQKNEKTNVRVFHSGKDHGKLALEIYDGINKTKTTHLSSRLITSDKVSVVSLRWNPEQIRVDVDGTCEIITELGSPITELEAVFIASRKGKDADGLFAHLSRFSAIPCFQNEVEVASFLYQVDPVLFAKFAENYYKSLEKIEWPVDIEKEIYGNLIERVFRAVETWNMALNLSLEDEYRDSLAQLLQMSDFHLKREPLEGGGFTDISVSLPITQHHEIGLSSIDVPIELKIWGRNDYDKAPQKPIKYMCCFQRLGFVVMVAESNIRDIRKKFFNIAKSNLNYPNSDDFIINPFGKYFPYHFTCTHKNPRDDSIKRIVYILFVPPEKSGKTRKAKKKA